MADSVITAEQLNDIASLTGLVTNHLAAIDIDGPNSPKTRDCRMKMMAANDRVTKIIVEKVEQREPAD